MTKEERAQRKKDYEEARQQEWREFPPFYTWRQDGQFHCLISLAIEGGSTRANITVEKSPATTWKKVDRKYSSDNEAVTVDLTIIELAELIRALAVRYNHLVRTVNDAVSGVSLPPLALINPEDTPRGGSQDEPPPSSVS